MLYDTATKIQNTDLADPVQASPVLAQLEQVIGFYEAHAGHENNLMLPLLKEHDPALAEEFFHEHDEDHELGNTLFNAMSLWKAATNDEERTSAGRDIFYAFNEFTAFNLRHMDKEEKLINPVLWHHYTDPELLQMNMRIIATIEPAVLAVQNKWMMQAINNKEAMAWLKGAKMTAPAEKFESFMAIARSAMEPERWELIQHALLQEN